MTIEELITFNQNGLVTANYVQIREALTDKYKEIYGSDIDISTASADGQYVSSISLVIYNMLESIKKMYNSLDPNVANGKFLDIICALSNITRKGPTKSYASLLVTNEAGTDYSASSITFVDKSNLTWVSSNSDGSFITIPAGESLNLIATCSKFGPISAEGSGDSSTPGWIYQTLDNSSLTVIQENDAVLGSYEESDSELRSRRDKSTGQEAITTLDGLTGNLLALDGIDDVKIYNNNTNADQTKKDNFTVYPHSILVAIRKNLSVNIEDSLIGSIIYENLTPGIGTDFATTVSDKETYYYPTVSFLEQPVYWRYAAPIHPQISIMLTVNESFDTTDEYKTIGEYMINLLNSKPIGENLDNNNLRWEAQYADPLSKGLPTYSVYFVAISGMSDQGLYTNKDNYYQYSTVSATVENNYYVITLN